MTKFQICYYRRLEKLVEITQKRFDNYRKKLSINCNHPIEFIVAYRWEHDNGYGRQSWRSGKRCTICLMLDAWANGNFRPASAYSSD